MYVLNMKDVKGLILAGGFGTRMTQRYPGIPKVLLPVGGKSVLEILIEHFVQYGITQIALSLHDQAERIKKTLRTGSQYGAGLTYFVEQEPRGSGGALSEIGDFFDTTLVVVNGDVVTTINLTDLHTFHKACNSQATLVVHRSDHSYDSDVVVMDDTNRVTKIYRPKADEVIVPIANAGMFVFEPSVLTFVAKEGAQSMEQDVIPRLIEAKMSVYGYLTDEYIKDMGTPERYRQVLQDFS